MHFKTVVVKLADELPCGAWANTDSGTCGKPAHVIFGQRSRARLGDWLVTPICRECANAAHGVYVTNWATSDQVKTAYQDGAS